ncbi:MAG: acyl-CoA dehydrogenase family protein [Deinococcota bacterium]|nr:acyl-CoA dehydrogenase family protein [Deinococcota bacterium]
MDSSYLDWPFLTPAHKAHALKIRAWAKDAARRMPPGDPHGDPHGDDVDALCRRWVGELARGGWLETSVSYEGRLDVRTLCLTREALASQDGLADFAFAMQGLGSGPITLFGTKEQKGRYLPAVARGEKVAAFALSEPEAGSDVASLAMSAVLDGDHYLLNGEKTWISNGGVADFYLVFARTGERPGAKGLSAFVVDAETPGLEIAERIEVIAPHPLARLRFAGCRVPAANLVGAAGAGFGVAMATLDVFRSTVGAAALGFARRALEEALAHTTRRELFGAPLADMQLTRARLAEMALEVDTSALLVYRAAWTRDCVAERVTREAAMAKLHATEAAQRVIDAAVQLHGGRGVRRGEMVERLYREIRALRIYEGASEVQGQVIARQVLRAFEEGA